MIFSIDTCVLLDMLLPDPDFGVMSKEKLAQAYERGQLIICPIVYAELCPQFDKQTSLDTFLKETGISMKPFTSEILWKAGEAWNEYRFYLFSSIILSSSRGGISATITSNSLKASSREGARMIRSFNALSASL